MDWIRGFNSSRKLNLTIFIEVGQRAYVLFGGLGSWPDPLYSDSSDHPISTVCNRIVWLKMNYLFNSSSPLSFAINEAHRHHPIQVPSLAAMRKSCKRPFSNQQLQPTRRKPLHPLCSSRAARSPAPHFQQ